MPRVQRIHPLDLAKADALSESLVILCLVLILGSVFLLMRALS